MRLILTHVFLIITVIATYKQVIDYDFLTWTDNFYVTNNPAVKNGINRNSVELLFKTVTTTHWHPVTMLSHMLDVEMYGLNPSGHHVTNLLFHLLNSLLLFNLLNYMTRQLWPSLIVATLFAVHPLHVENVVWISDRKDLLCTFFGFLTLWAYVLYVRRRDLFCYGAAIVFLSFGLLSKTMLVTFPFVLILLDCWPLHRSRLLGEDLDKASCKSTKRNHVTIAVKWLVIEKMPFLILCIIGSFASYFILRDSGMVQAVGEVPLLLRFGNMIVSYVRYIIMMFYPVNLLALYLHPNLPEGTPWSMWQIMGSFIILIIISYIILIRSQKLYAKVGWLWYLGTMLPVSGLIQLGKPAMAARYAYIPLIGLYIIVSWGVSEITGKSILYGKGYVKYFISAIGVVIFVALIALSQKQSEHWRNSRSFYEHELEMNPNNPYFHNNIGLTYKDSQLYDKAFEHFQMALKIKPDLWQAHMNIALIYNRQGNYDKATYHYNKGKEFRKSLD